MLGSSRIALGCSDFAAAEWMREHLHRQLEAVTCVPLSMQAQMSKRHPLHAITALLQEQPVRVFQAAARSKQR
jgi:hypothetical protein